MIENEIPTSLDKNSFFYEEVIFMMHKLLSREHGYAVAPYSYMNIRYTWRRNLNIKLILVPPSVAGCFATNE